MTYENGTFNIKEGATKNWPGVYTVYIIITDSTGSVSKTPM